jgi:hypothetical protein
MNIAGAATTPNWLHCQRQKAKTIVATAGHYILMVKARLRAQLKALSCNHIPCLGAQNGDHTGAERESTKPARHSRAAHDYVPDTTTAFRPGPDPSRA